MKFRISYQENMTLEEVARNRPPMSLCPDTESFQIVLGPEYLVNEQEQIT